MTNSLGIRREDKNRWESRVPLTPEQIKELSEKYNIKVILQPSPIRAFPDEEYINKGAFIDEELKDCSVILGIKEMPQEFFQAKKTYVFFSHTIKGQSYNMPMLKKLIDLKCNLIDYERIVNTYGKRLIFFGHFAGLAGMIDTLWAFGKRLETEGIKTPFSKIKRCIEYRNLSLAKKAISEVGKEIKKYGLPDIIKPLVCGFAGYGHVSRGAQEIFDLLPFIKITPEQLPSILENQSNNHLYKVVFKVRHMAEPIDKKHIFKMWHYFKNPREYKGRFEQYLPYLTILMNCIYWDEKYPRIITKKYLKQSAGDNALKLKVIGDISCDINGGVECTEKATKPDEPAFIYNPLKDEISNDFKEPGVVVMAVDNLPCELPVEASDFFGESLKKYIPEMIQADYTVDFYNCILSPDIKNAMIVYQGKLTPNYTYMEKFL